MSARAAFKTAREFRWYHWAGSIASAGAINVGLLAALAKTYKWVYSDHEESVRRFTEAHGEPTEAQRLDVFRWFGPTWDGFMGPKERGGAEDYRMELYKGARGHVLEVAVGTGRCFEALAQSGEVQSFVGVDCVEEMLHEARKKLEGLAFPARVLCADAHKLPFPDASFDTVTGSVCLCSVEKPAVALAEMARVCKQDGQVLLLEPGLANSWVVRAGQRYLGLVPDPKHAWELGWHDDLNPTALVQACPQLRLANVQTRALGNWYLITATPPVE